MKRARERVAHAWSTSLQVRFVGTVLIVSAIVWGFGANSSNPHLASRGKIGVLVSCGAAVICGASVTLINFFWGVGQSV